MANPDNYHDQLTCANKHENFTARCVAEIDGVGFDFQDHNADENDELSEFLEVVWENELMIEEKVAMPSSSVLKKLKT